MTKGEDLQERFLPAAEKRLRARPEDEERLNDEHIKKVKFGELALALDIFKEAAKHIPFPGDPRRAESGLPPGFGTPPLLGGRRILTKLCETLAALQLHYPGTNVQLVYKAPAVT